MRNAQWLAAAIAWDGMLPVVVGFVPVLVKLAIPRNDMAIILSCLALPIFAAVIRTALASWQLQQVCQGALPLSRQMALAVAILFLLLFEILVACLTFDPMLPTSLWLTVVGLYLVYVALIVWALRSAASTQSAEIPN